MDTQYKVAKRSSRFSNNSKCSGSKCLKFNKPSQSTKLETKNIETLLSAVNSSSLHVRNFYITFLLTGIYIAIIIWSTTDIMLLKETPVNLPLLNAALPITGFYRFAPFFYLLLHFNLLIQLCLLSDKLHGFNAALSKLKDDDTCKYYITQLFPLVFSHTLSGRQHTNFLRFLLTTMVWITVIWLPLCLLIGLQVGFLAYHNEQILELQRWAIIADLGILSVFWPIIRSPDGKWLTWVFRALVPFSINRWFIRKKYGFLKTFVEKLNIMPLPSGIPIIEVALSLITVITIIGFSWGVAVLPDSDNEKQVAKRILSVSQWLGQQDEPLVTLLSKNHLNIEGNRYFRLTEYLFDESIFHRNLTLQKRLLIANELKPEDIAYLTDNNKEIPEGILRKIVGLDLRGRDLRYANFKESLMPKVDFLEINRVVTKLQNASFPNAILFKAKMAGVHLQGANLRFTQLQGADLKNAQLQGADLERAQLQGVDLSSSQLQGSDLNYAQLQGANMGNAQLQGTSMYSTQLQGADLSYAQLQGADLKNAQLQGAYLSGAKLQAADLEGTELTLTNITSNFTGVTFGKITELEIKELLKRLSVRIKNQKLLKKIENILLKAMSRSVNLSSATGQNIWIENNDEIVQKAFRESKGNLDFAKSESIYQNGLSVLLIELSCQDKWVAAGIVRYRPKNILLKTSFTQCLQSLKNKKNNSGQTACPGLSEISKKNIDQIKQKELKKDFKNNIQSTFKCKNIALD